MQCVYRIYIYKTHGESMGQGLGGVPPLPYACTSACAQRRGSCCHSDRGGVVRRRGTCIYIDLYSCMYLNIAMMCRPWLYIYMHNTSVSITINVMVLATNGYFFVCVSVLC